MDDPLTARKIPTCHRSSFQSVLEDYADVQRETAPVPPEKRYKPTDLHPAVEELLEREKEDRKEAKRTVSMVQIVIYAMIGLISLILTMCEKMN